MRETGKGRLRSVIIVGLMLVGSMLIVPENVSAGPDIAIVYYPSEVRAGLLFPVSWNVLGTGAISHTNVHWGYGTGLNASDYPNSGKVFTGTAPASINDTSLRAPLVPGRIYLRVHLIMDKEYVSNEFTIDILPLSNATKPEVTIIYYPENGLSPGATYNVTWQATGGKLVQHTNVHWGTQSNNYPNEGEPQNSTSPQIFTNVLTAPISNLKVFFIIHFKVDSIDYYTKEYYFQVGISPTPEMVNVNYPSSVVAGGYYNISWRIEGGAPGNISLTRVVWGRRSNELTDAGASFSGNTPFNFQDRLKAPVDSLRVYFEIHYVVDTIQLFSPECSINVTGGVQVMFRFIQSPPAIVRVDKPFIVSWTIEGGNIIEMTRFEWGTTKGLHPNHGNEFAGRSGDKFTDQINGLSNSSGAYVYYVVYYKVDGVDFTSGEGSFHPYREGAGLNYATESIIFSLVVITLILAYFIVRRQKKERQRGKGEIGITDAKRAALVYLTSFYKVKEELFKFYDAYPSGGDGFEIVYTSPKGSIRYKIYVDNDGHVVRLMGGTRRA